MSTLLAPLDAAPVIAILRGVRPEEVEPIGLALFDAGVRCIEVPLNSPEPLRSLRRLRDLLDGRALVGAGTVLEVDMVRAVSEAGGQLVVSPNTDPDVIRATRDAGLISAPGFLTPTEAFLALRAGADILKLFPGEFAGPGVLRAMRAVLPPAVRVYAVGGVQAETVGPWLAAGASGFGIGSRIFSPGMSPEDVRRRASRFMAELKAQLASQAGGQA